MSWHSTAQHSAVREKCRAAAQHSTSRNRELEQKYSKAQQMFPVAKQSAGIPDAQASMTPPLSAKAAAKSDQEGYASGPATTTTL